MNRGYVNLNDDNRRFDSNDNDDNNASLLVSEIELFPLYKSLISLENMSDFFCLYVSNMNSLLCYDDLVYAWQRASSGKKKRREVQQWMEHFDTNMQHLYTDIV